MKTFLLLIITALTLNAQERARVELLSGNVVQYKNTQPAPTVASQWLPVIRNAQPAYNSTNEYLTQTTTVTNGTVVIDWIVINKAQQQLDDEAAAAALAADLAAKRQAVSNAVATLRTWSDQAESTVVTSGNAVATLQTMVDRLGVFFDRFADKVEADGL